MASVWNCMARATCSVRMPVAEKPCIKGWITWNTTVSSLSHNTVCVDGISSYPVMKSNHSFKLRALYPAAGERLPYQPISYSEVYFREPETFADRPVLTELSMWVILQVIISIYSVAGK